jgi:cytoskeleton protein RodZ
MISSSGSPLALTKSDPMMAFGEQLRRAREKSGISLDELSARTKIRVSILEAIERGDLARLPAIFYTKAFVRAYAAEVRLDPEPIVQEYVALSEPPPPAPQQTELRGVRDTPPPPSMAELFGLVRPGLAPLAMFAVAGLLLFAVFKFSHTDRPGPSADVEPGAVATGGNTPPSQAPQGTAAGENSIAPVAHQPDRLTVEIRPTGILWLEGTADGERVIRRLLQPREHIVIDARDEIRLLIGDAGAFDYSINGRPGRRLGGPGEVRTIDVNRANYEELLSTASE